MPSVAVAILRTSSSEIVDKERKAAAVWFIECNMWYGTRAERSMPLIPDFIQFSSLLILPCIYPLQKLHRHPIG